MPGLLPRTVAVAPLGPGLRDLAGTIRENHVRGKSDSLESSNDEPRGVRLPPTEAVASGGGKGVVVVVPCLAEGRHCQPGEVAGLIVRLVRLAAEGVAERVDA